MKRSLTFTLVVFLLSCGQSDNKLGGQSEKKSDSHWKAIEVGDYLFDFPGDFELLTEKGIDSYVGKIKGDSMWFGFDFGYYSDDFEQTPKEYLDNGHWRYNLASRFMKVGITYDQTNMPKVDILSIRSATAQDSSIGKGCDYVAKCIHEETEFDYAVYIPSEIKELNFEIDTVDNLYRKIVWAKDPQKGKTGIYLRELNGFNESINSYLALSMSTYKLTIEQQKTALKIFKTGRHKNAQR